jgi:hypothetical protein
MIIMRDQWMHICDDGSPCERWYQVNAKSSLFFEQVESIFCSERLAHNMVKIEKIRSCGQSDDYHVLVNLPEDIQDQVSDRVC